MHEMDRIVHGELNRYMGVLWTRGLYFRNRYSITVPVRLNS